MRSNRDFRSSQECGGRELGGACGESGRATAAWMTAWRGSCGDGLHKPAAGGLPIPSGSSLCVFKTDAFSYWLFRLRHGAHCAAGRRRIPEASRGEEPMTTPSAAPLRVALTNGSFEQPAVTSVEILPDASQTRAAKRVPAGSPAPPTTRSSCGIRATTVYRQPTAPSSPSSTPTGRGRQVLVERGERYWRAVPPRPQRGRHHGAGHRRAGIHAEQRRSPTATLPGYYTGTYTVPAGQTLRASPSAPSQPPEAARASATSWTASSSRTAPYVELAKTAIPAGPLEVGDVSPATASPPRTKAAAEPRTAS